MKKMPKHVAIGVVLRNSLRAKEFITILNRNGDYISYDDCLAIDAYCASEIVMVMVMQLNLELFTTHNK